MSEEQDIHDLIVSHFNAQGAAGINATYQLDLKDGGSFFLKVENNSFTFEQGEAHDPNVTLNTDEKTLKGIINGQINGMQAFMMGKIKFSGDMGLAMKLKDLFS